MQVYADILRCKSTRTTVQDGVLDLTGLHTAVRATHGSLSLYPPVGGFFLSSMSDASSCVRVPRARVFFP